MNLYSPLCEILNTTDHPTIRASFRIASLDEGYLIARAVEPIVAALNDPATTDSMNRELRHLSREIVSQILAVESAGYIPCEFELPGDEWDESTRRNRNCGCQFDDTAYRSAMNALRLLAPFTGSLEDAAWAAYGRCLDFIIRVFNKTQARGIPHTVNCDGVSIQARKHEPAGILSIREATDLITECNNAPDQFSDKTDIIIRKLANFLKVTRGIGTLGANEWPRYVWDGDAASNNQLDIYDCTPYAELSGDWPIKRGLFEAQ